MKPDYSNIFGEPINTELYLYHFTTCETALEYILKDMQLRLSPTEKLNDPKETELSFELADTEEDPSDKELLKLFKFFKKNVKVACFCIDKSRTIEEQQKDSSLYNGRGFNHPRMWAQYGGNHKGVCLVFNKDELINDTRNSIKTSTLYSERVSYSDKYILETSSSSLFKIDSTIFNKHGVHYTAEEMIKKDWKTYYYTKMSDWKDEAEHRIVLLSESEEYDYIKIQKSLKAVIVGHLFPLVYLPTLRALIKGKDAKIGQMKWYHGIAQLIDEFDNAT